MSPAAARAALASGEVADAVRLLVEALEAGEYRCRYRRTPCVICAHEACGWCPECAPEVPQ